MKNTRTFTNSFCLATQHPDRLDHRPDHLPALPLRLQSTRYQSQDRAPLGRTIPALVFVDQPDIIRGLTPNVRLHDIHAWALGYGDVCILVLQYPVHVDSVFRIQVVEEDKDCGVEGYADSR